MIKLFFLLAIFIQTSSFSQNTNEIDILIELGKQAGTYNNQEPSKKTPENILAKLSKIKNANCQFAIDFTLETLKENNDLINDKYLIKPSKEILIQLYTIEIIQGFSNFYSGEELKNAVISNSKSYRSNEELLYSYYDALYGASKNRNKSTPFFKKNIDLNNYNLETSTEKAIFYFSLMRYLSPNVLFPILTNTEIVKFYCLDFNVFPTINNKDFYYYTDLDFNDFETNLVNFNGSYKHFYINETFNTIFTYIKCREKHFVSKGEISDIVNNSILSNKEFYRYCEKKEILNEILAKYSSEK
jgi:hypothetical protein